MKYLILLCIFLTLTACSTSEVDTTHIVRIDEEQALSCTAMSDDLKDQHSHAFYEDENMIKVLQEAKEAVVKKKGNAFLVKSFTMDYDYNTSKIIYQAFLCP